MPEDLWRTEVSVARDQVEPRVFSGRTREEVREAVYQWLLTARPTSIRSRERRFEKRDGWWSPTGVERDEVAYRQFCNEALYMERDTAAMC